MSFLVKAIDARIKNIIDKWNECACPGCPDLQDFANALNISVSHLRHLFTKEVGVSPSKYLKLVRLEKLRRLLKGSKVQIKQALSVTGFSDFSHAVRDYKAVYGQTPLQTNNEANRKVDVELIVPVKKKRWPRTSAALRRSSKFRQSIAISANGMALLDVTS